MYMVFRYQRSYLVLNLGTILTFGCSPAVSFSLSQIIFLLYLFGISKP